MEKILQNGAPKSAQFSAPATVKSFRPTNNSDRPDAATVAARLNLTRRDGDTWRGPNPFTGEGTDRFCLFPELNATERDGTKYSRAQVLERAGFSFPLDGERQVSPPAKAPKIKPKTPPFDWLGARKFDYVDEGGALLFQIGRTRDGAAKAIRQRRPDGRGGWLYSLGEVRRVLWRLPDVMNAQIVFICEGEKAADALNSALERAGLLGEHIATTGAQGAGKWRDEMAAALDGKRVCVLPDLDAPGSAHGATVCGSIYTRGAAAALKRLDLPELPPKGDVCDWLDAGGTVARLLDLLDATPLWEPLDGGAGVGAPSITAKFPLGDERDRLTGSFPFATLDAARVPAPQLRTERGTLDFDGRQLVELLYPHWECANLSTHVAMGKRAGELLGDVLRYIPALGWVWWNGKKWTLDDKAATGASARVAALSERVGTEGAALYRLATLLAGSGRGPDAEAMGRAAGLQLRHTKQVEARGFVEGALHFAAAHPALRSPVETFDARPWVLGFANGVWDRGEFRAHRREDFLLHLCPVAFDFHADRFQWEAVLERMTGGDWSFARTLQDVAGYVLAGAPNLRVLPWLYGPKGTGKSTFAELLQTVLGEQSAQIDARALDGGERERLGAALWNRRLAVCSESGNKRLDAELLKTLSGGDRLPVRQLFKEAFTALPRHVLMMVANDAPRLDAYDGALKDRVMALPFVHPMDAGARLDFTGADGSKLSRLEAARVDPASPLVAGFTAWALDGLEHVYREQSIERAPCVVAATAQFWSDTDTLTPFWESLGEPQLDALDGQGLPKSELRGAYETWCEHEGARPLGRSHWVRACESQGLEECRLLRQGAPEARGWRFKTKRKR